MSRIRSALTQSKVRAAVKGALEAGMHVARVEVGADGTIVIYGGVPVGNNAPECSAEEELERWRREKNNAR
jgi:hypothetical protein